MLRRSGNRGNHRRAQRPEKNLSANRFAEIVLAFAIRSTAYYLCTSVEHIMAPLRKDRVATQRHPSHAHAGSENRLGYRRNDQ
jgi:hypothetical protein